MINQALGVPTGDHGIFNIYHIDAITLMNVNLDKTPTYSKLHIAKTLEGTFRALNNLIEHLHQSFYYYLLPAPYAYISIGEYMISLGLILIAFALKVLSGVLTLKYKPSTIHSLCVVGVFQIIGIIIFAIPFIIQRLAPFVHWTFTSVDEVMAFWLASSIMVVLVGYFVVVPAVDRYFTTSKNYTLDSDSYVTLASLPIVLFSSTFSLLNFSFCLFCGVFMVPIYGLLQATNNKLLLILQVIIMCSPPALFVLATYLLNQDLLTILGKVLLQYQLFSNLSYPFLCMIYIPANLSFFKFITSK